MKKVVIVGAGVVGLILGKELARKGIETTIYESKSAVSQNAARASGIFSSEGLARFGVDYKGAVVNTMNGAVIHGGGESFSVNTKQTKAYILDRGIFAELCKREAQAAGAKIILGKRLSKDELAAIANDKDTTLVGADGAVSSVASAFGFPEIREHILTYKAEFENVNVKDMHSVELFFSNKISNRFFGWTVPYSTSKLEVGIGISGYSKRTSSAAFSDFVSTKPISEMLGSAVMVAAYASIIPLGFRKKTVIGNVMLVGDAAGQVKATTGGGIVFGVSCAKIAADVIYAHITEGKSLENYEREWRRSYALDLRLHRFVHEYYSSLNERGFALAIKMSRALGFEKFLSVYGDMDSPKLIFKRFFVRKISV